MPVMTFSRVFPGYHPRAGEPTYFVEQIYNCLINSGQELSMPGDIPFLQSLSNRLDLSYKYHTIRAGNRWKVGDKFSPRVWSGKPCRSKQIIIGPDIEVKKVWDIEINRRGGAAWFEVVINGEIFGQTHNGYDKDRNRCGLELLAEAEGLTLEDFKEWFQDVPFTGQIICWSDKINY